MLPIAIAHLRDREFGLGGDIFERGYDLADSEVSRESVRRIASTTKEDGDVIGSGRVLFENTIKNRITRGGTYRFENL